MKTKAQWEAMISSLPLYNQAYINGQFVSASKGDTFACVNPATETLIADVAHCGQTEVDQAVANARQVFNEGVWSRRHPRDRKTVLLKLVDLLHQHQDELALIDTLNMGKPISETVNIDIPHALDCFQWAAEYCDKLYGEVAPTDGTLLSMTTYDPVGVVACITPWNYPFMITVWKISSALAAGNSVIIKPSEKTPFSALLLASLATEAGLPAGVLNVLPGLGNTTGKALAVHHEIDLVAFTGATSTGAKIMSYASQSNMKKVLIESGGKGANIIFADADIDQAATVSAGSIFSNQGEICAAGSRLYIDKSIKDDFLAAFIQATQYYQAGNPLSPETTLGPLVDKAQLNRVNEYIQSAIDDGAHIILGGISEYRQGEGFYARPTIIEHSNNQLICVQEEIFGPVIVITTFETEEEAISLANDTQYGLGNYIWTANLSRAHRVSQQLNASMIWVNTWPEGEPSMPFGGRKLSGNTQERSHHAIKHYMELKTVIIRT